MGEKKSFVLHKDYHNQIKKLSDEDAAALLRAIFAYVNGEEVGELSPVADMVFSFIAAQIDRDNAKYKARCERNKANGKKGGRPKKEEPNETEENPKEPNETERFSGKPKKADNDNDNDNDNQVRFVRPLRGLTNLFAAPPMKDYEWGIKILFDF